MIYIDYYNNIKNKLINNEINKKVKYYSINKNDLNTYYRVGKMLSEAGKGYTFTSLTRVRKFYNLIEKLATVSQHLSYGQYVELLPYDNINKIKYYINLVEEQNLTIRQLRNRIKENDYKRIPNTIRENIVNKGTQDIVNYIKNPIILKSSTYKIIRILHKIILDDIESFMKELGP